MMTLTIKEEWRDLPAGPVFDVFVGWEVFGARAKHEHGQWWQRRADTLAWEPHPQYSTDIAAAWQVVDALARREFIVRLYAGPMPPSCEVSSMVGDDGPTVDVSETGDTMPHVICRAALAAMEAA